MSALPNPAAAATVPVWDPLVRIGHWTLAVSVLVAYATGEHAGAWHERIGYVALIAAAIRVAWGFVGPVHARFTDFVPGPAALSRYVRALVAGREPRHIGHNPLGGAWIVLMLVLVIATGATGWALSGYGHHEARALEETHEVLAATILVAAAVHVAGVAFESLRHRENLVRSMFTGRKRGPGPDDA